MLGFRFGPILAFLGVHFGDKICARSTRTLRALYMHSTCTLEPCLHDFVPKFDSKKGSKKWPFLRPLRARERERDKWYIKRGKKKERDRDRERKKERKKERKRERKNEREKERKPFPPSPASFIHLQLFISPIHPNMKVLHLQKSGHAYIYIYLFI